MAGVDWVLLSKYSHSSRHVVQRTCLKYAVSLISAEVNISVEKGDAGRPHITDQSGEVIALRYGDGFCLNCLGRIAPARVAAESHPDPVVRQGIVERGYVQGMDVKESAVMPLNAVIAVQTIQTLMDQYREDAAHEPVTVYESHDGGRMYADWESLANLLRRCFSCGRDLSAEMEKDEEAEAAQEVSTPGAQPPVSPQHADSNEDDFQSMTDKEEPEDSLCPAASDYPQEDQQETERKEETPDAMLAIGGAVIGLGALSALLNVDATSPRPSSPDLSVHDMRFGQDSGRSGACCVPNDWSPFPVRCVGSYHTNQCTNKEG